GDVDYSEGPHQVIQVAFRIQRASQKILIFGESVVLVPFPVDARFRGQTVAERYGRRSSASGCIPRMNGSRSVIMGVIVIVILSGTGLNSNSR
ncbi:MAG: hypothetical protein NTW27_01190, partial [Deltaproteobacteria bacterium]|nr:hypothetical protein [Deltaproteobacteria bacterium]